MPVGMLSNMLVATRDPKIRSQSRLLSAVARYKPLDPAMTPQTLPMEALRKENTKLNIYIYIYIYLNTF